MRIVTIYLPYIFLHYSIKLSKSTCHMTRRVAISGSDFLRNDISKLYGSIYSLSIIDQLMGI